MQSPTQNPVQTLKDPWKQGITAGTDLLLAEH